MRRIRRLVPVALAAMLAAAGPVTAEKGRVYEEGRRMRLSFAVGDRSAGSGWVVERGSAWRAAASVAATSVGWCA